MDTNNRAEKLFKELLDITDTLMGPQGCPWDREQTLISTRAAILEEACEAIEAIDEKNDIELAEELGDLLFIIAFYCKLGEKEKRFTTENVLQGIVDKLILRHPHVFGEKKIETIDELAVQWEAIKAQEKSHRTSLLDGIPKGLPALARAYKIAGKMKHAGHDVDEEESLFENEEELGELLWQLIRQARKQKLNPELALRKEMLNRESSFRYWEKNRNEF